LKSRESSEQKERKGEQTLNMSCFNNSLGLNKSFDPNSFISTYSDVSTPARDATMNTSVKHKFSKESLGSGLDSQDNTKRPSSYSKYKLKAKKAQLKVSRTSKQEAMVNVIERRIIQELKKTERVSEGSEHLHNRIKVIEECLTKSIVDIYPALQSTMNILADEVRNLFAKQENSYENEMNLFETTSKRHLDQLKEKEIELKSQQKVHEQSISKLTSEIFQLSQKHEKEVLQLQKELQKKNSEIVGQMKKFILQDIDLDEYNITSDDFRPTSLSLKPEQPPAEEKIPANDTKGHPLVPKLDFRKITLEEESSHEVTPHIEVQ
jgi:predicted ArsR family transcriptional regulator